MCNFLRDHYRYNVMNSWNRSTSYANNIKVYNLDLPADVQKNMYEIIDEGSFYDECSWILRTFNDYYNQSYQIGHNGRSGGYLVIYQGGLKTLKYKSRCHKCGQLNYNAVEENDEVKESFGVCGACGEVARANLKHPITQAYCTGAALDDNHEFLEWDINTLRERVELVQHFDITCDSYVNAFCDFCRRYKVEDTVVMVPQQTRQLVLA